MRVKDIQTLNELDSNIQSVLEQLAGLIHDRTDVLSSESISLSADTRNSLDVDLKSFDLTINSKSGLRSLTPSR